MPEKNRFCRYLTPQLAFPTQKPKENRKEKHEVFASHIHVREATLCCEFYFQSLYIKNRERFPESRTQSVSGRRSLTAKKKGVPQPKTPHKRKEGRGKETCLVFRGRSNEWDAEERRR